MPKIIIALETNSDEQITVNVPNDAQISSIGDTGGTYSYVSNGTKYFDEIVIPEYFDDLWGFVINGVNRIPARAIRSTFESYTYRGAAVFGNFLGQCANVDPTFFREAIMQSSDAMFSDIKNELSQLRQSVTLLSGQMNVVNHNLVSGFTLNNVQSQVFVDQLNYVTDEIRAFREEVRRHQLLRIEDAAVSDDEHLFVSASSDDGASSEGGEPQTLQLHGYVRDGREQFTPGEMQLIHEYRPGGLHLCEILLPAVNIYGCAFERELGSVVRGTFIPALTKVKRSEFENNCVHVACYELRFPETRAGYWYRRSGIGGIESHIIVLYDKRYGRYYTAFLSERGTRDSYVKIISGPVEICHTLLDVSQSGPFAWGVVYVRSGFRYNWRETRVQRAETVHIIDASDDPPEVAVTKAIFQRYVPFSHISLSPAMEAWREQFGGLCLEDENRTSVYSTVDILSGIPTNIGAILRENGFTDGGLAIEILTRAYGEWNAVSIVPCQDDCVFNVALGYAQHENTREWLRVFNAWHHLAVNRVSKGNLNIVSSIQSDHFASSNIKLYKIMRYMQGDAYEYICPECGLCYRSPFERGVCEYLDNLFTSIVAAGRGYVRTSVMKSSCNISPLDDDETRNSRKT